MNDAVLMVFLSVLQGFGAYYAFNTEGLLAKVAGLFFCLAALLGLLAAGIFWNDEQLNRKKGENRR